MSLADRRLCHTLTAEHGTDGRFGWQSAEFKKDFDKLLEFSMQGSTVVNPIKVSEDDMKKFLDCIFYGKKVEF